MVDDYRRILEKYLEQKKPACIVQVGANDGRINDPIYEIVMRHKDSTRILLIEPQKEVLPFLYQSYRDHPYAIIHNGAVGPDKELSLYRVRPQYWDIFKKQYLVEAPSYRVPSGFASSVKEHVIAHVKGNLPEHVNLSESIEEIRIPSTDLETLLRKYDLTKDGVDVLQIDAEGMDDIVIYACNIPELMPSIINFEHSHLPGPRYQRLCDSLSLLGYVLRKWSDNDTLALFRLDREAI